MLPVEISRLLAGKNLYNNALQSNPREFFTLKGIFRPVDVNDLLLYGPQWLFQGSPPGTFVKSGSAIPSGYRLKIKVKAKDRDRDSIVYLAGGLPGDATFENGKFEWAPGEGDRGAFYEVTFVANDGQATDWYRPKVCG